MHLIFRHTILILSLAVMLTSCGESSPSFKKQPIDDMVRDMSGINNYSILLYDMDYVEDKDVYRHQYQIIKEVAAKDTLVSETTDWKVVGAEYFNAHVEDMGMALVTKQDGKVEKAVSPPGYNQHVGNEKYGEWRSNSSGGSFWAFYGQYAFMRSLFGYGYSPIYRRGWNDYRGNYYGSGRTYYGRSDRGGTRFGTNGQHTKARSTNSRWSGKSSSFKQRVRSKAKRSTSRSRSSSRYRSRSSSRSRGFGGGK